MVSHFFTSESVTEGHPDKLCDRISDAILDAYLAQDPNAHCAIEALATTGIVVVAGELKTDPCKRVLVDADKVIRQAVKDIGYDRPEYGFDSEYISVLSSLHDQSLDINMGVCREKKGKKLATGAGDQGLMFGYATDETPELMPLPILMKTEAGHAAGKLRKEERCRG